MNGALLVYGSYGYTGRLIAREAVSRGDEPTVGGRDRERVSAQAAELGVPFRSFSLDAPGLDRRIGEFDAVLNCAGPFVDTCDPLIEACLATGTDYLDITGEFRVFERLSEYDERADAAGVTLLPGVGFDVVPSDCLAAAIADRLPSADELTLGIAGSGSLSRGTALTMVENLGTGGIVRRNGRLIRVPAAYRTREIDFGRGPTTAVTIPWGDVVTAYHSTGIGNVEVYASASESAIRAANASDSLDWLVGSRPVRSALERLVESRVDGPDEKELADGSAIVWGAVTDDERTATARLRTPNPYALTAESAVVAARRVLDGDAPSGFQTPSTAFGADFALDLDGVEREFVELPARSTAQ